MSTPRNRFFPIIYFLATCFLFGARWQASSATHLSTNVDFALKFTENLRHEWWDITPDERKGGEQILFNGKIYMDNSAIVHPHKLSTIYRLGTNKKALSGLDNAHLVELVGTAPTSASVLVSLLQA